MSKLTNFLKLFEWDTSNNEDLNSNFNIDKALNENFDKIDNFASNCKNNSANAIKQELSKIKEAQINSTGADLQDVQFFGESMQKSREGYNILKHYYNKGFTYTINGMTFTINDDYSVTINGTATGDAFFNLNNVEGYYTQITEGETYTAYTGVANEGLSFALKTLDNTLLIYSTNVIQKSYVSTYSGNTCMYLKVTSGYTLNNLTVYPMLVKGTEITEYEPYGAMPSIDYPSPISSITNINYKTTGKNIFDGEMELGSINWINGEFEDNANCIRSKNYIEVIPGQYYAFSNSRNYTHNVYNYDKNKQFINAEAVSNNTSYQIPANAKYIRFRTTQGTIENNLDTDFQIEKGSTVTAFEAYKKKTSAIILPEGVELCGTSDVQDKIDYTGLIHKKLKKVLLTGTENWNIFKYGTAHVNTTMFNVTIADLINKDNSVKMCSTLEIKENTTETLNSDTEWIMCNSAKGVFISINNNRLESLDETGLKKFLISNNIEILIELAEETTQNLAETEKTKLQNIETFEGVNNITSNAPISAVYNTDTKSYIDSKFNTLAQQILNMVGGN
nr:MAG TPA: hypothetical protein [Caudoviricetes sp.]